MATTPGPTRRSSAAEVVEPEWPLAGSEDLRDLLLAAYSADTRRYHDVRHLAEVVDRLHELTDDPGVALLLAAWFHDAVYDGGPDLEERSAQLAETALTGRVPDAIVAEVARLVRLTASHRPDPGDLLGERLCDADLAILAAPPARYEEYAAAVRAEHADVPDHLFRVGRAAVLGDLLAKETLFHTGYAREAWEQAARANVEAELSRLTG